MTETPPEAPSDDSDRSKRLRKAYSEATTALRDEYKDRFQELYVGRARALGITDYNPKPSAEQRAEAQMEALLAEFPGLKEKFVSDA